MLALSPSLASICWSAATPFAVGSSRVCAEAPELARKRDHCGVAKINSLSFRIGPPAENPKVLLMETGFRVIPEKPSSAGIAERFDGAIMSHPAPCQVFV